MVAEEDEMQDKFCKTLVEVGLLEEPKEENEYSNQHSTLLVRTKISRSIMSEFLLVCFWTLSLPSQKEHFELKF